MTLSKVDALNLFGKTLMKLDIIEFFYCYGDIDNYDAHVYIKDGLYKMSRKVKFK